MTTRSLDLLERLTKQLLLIPATTRSIEQYNRIQLGTIIPEYALVCNGGILLHNGISDDQWYRKSLELVQPAESVMEKAMEVLTSDPDRTFEIRYIEKLFIFTKSRQPEKTVNLLKQELDISRADVFFNGTKVYVLPKALTKGNAVLRLKNQLSADKIIAAGDSELDISMLLAADYGFCPAGLLSLPLRHIKQLPESDFVFRMLQEVEKVL
ncbi:MAG: HAD hydrolase family protein [Lachnospiraceae bacterium]